MTIRITCLILAVAAMSAGATDASGVWSLRLLTSAGESAARAAVTLKQNGETLTGTCAIDQIEQGLTVTGRVKDDTLTWRCVGKASFEASFTGTIDATGRQMSGEWGTGAARGTFKGSRAPK
jgi:hypothetical protein